MKIVVLTICLILAQSVNGLTADRIVNERYHDLPPIEKSPVASECNDLKIVVESSIGYQNKFIWYGYHVANDTVVGQVSLSWDEFDLSGAWFNPIDDVEDVERYDLAIGYTWQITNSVTSRIGMGSFLYSELDKDDGFDVHSVNWTLHHDSGVAYTLVYAWPDNSASVVEEGQLHILHIGREVGPLRAFGDIIYNDGFSPFGNKSVDDFSCVQAGIVVNGPLNLRTKYYHQWALNNAFKEQDVISIGFRLRT